MAYLSKEKTKEFRDKLRKEFPAKDGWKLSIRNEHYSGIMIKILKGPIRFSDKDYDQLNIYYPESYQNAEVLKRMINITMDGNYDNSDAMTDYFDIGWYVWIHQGDWDKTFELTTK